MVKLLLYILLFPAITWAGQISNSRVVLRNAVSQQTSSSYRNSLNQQAAQSYNYITSKAGCFVGVDLSCRDPYDGGRPVYENMSWREKSYEARLALFESKTNPNDVQNSYQSCYYFAQMLKTECGIKEPVQIFFTAKENEEPLMTFLSSAHPRLSLLNNLPDIFNKYFNGLLYQEPNYFPSSAIVGQTQNSVSLNKQGVFVSTANSNFSFGIPIKEKKCVVSAGRESCQELSGEDASFRLAFDRGFLRVMSDKYGETYRIDVRNFKNAKLEYLNTWPYMQIIGDEGIAWAASNQFANFKLNSGQRLHLTADITFKNIFLMMQVDGDLVLRSLDDGLVLWHSDTVNQCSKTIQGCDNKSNYVAEFKNGRLTLRYGRDSNFEKIWETDVVDGEYLRITSTFPYLAVYSSKKISQLKEMIQLWPNSNKIGCTSRSQDNVTCLHPEMPLYVQGDSKILDFINQKEKTNFDRDQGWCAPTSVSMIGKTFANEKLKYFDFSKGISSTKTNSFLDTENYPEIFWNFTKTLGMNIPEASVYVPVLGYTYKGSGVPIYALLLIISFR